MMAKYDVVVIGTGSAASTVAMRCSKAGKQVAVIDSRPYGSTCALRRCDPKKVLVCASELVDLNRHTKENGGRHHPAGYHHSAMATGMGGTPTSRPAYFQPTRI